jgi:hypothetical protein
MNERHGASGALAKEHQEADTALAVSIQGLQQFCMICTVSSL